MNTDNITGKILNPGELKVVGDKISASTPEPQPVEKPNPFDPGSLRIDPGFIETACVEKLLTIVPVGRPNSQEFFRVHPDPAYRLTAAIIEMKSDREIYLVRPEMAPGLVGEYALATLYATITRDGTVSLWPVKIPGSDGRVNRWHKSAADGAEEATKHWVRLKPNMTLGGYEILVAKGAIPDPVWPEHTLMALLEIAFRDGRLVDKPDHELMRRLRGEI
jgi:hypothetical protein